MAIEKASKEKVEKVVNPPQKPVTRKAFSLGERIPDLWNRAVIRPKRKQPRMLMVKVARGQSRGLFLKKA